MKRSGNHAVIHWMKSVGNAPFYNNIAPLKKVSREGRLDAPRVRIHSIIWKRKLKEIKKGILRPDCRIISIEDMPVGRELFSNDPKDVRHVLIIRDPKNLFASRVKKAFKITHPAYPRCFDKMARRAVALWKQHAYEALETTRSLTPKTVVMFDKWVRDADYRRAVAWELRIEPNSEALFQLAREGGGSSFGDEAVTKGVLDRSAMLNAHERSLFEAYLDDPEVIQLRNALLDAYRVPIPDTTSSAQAC